MLPALREEHFLDYEKSLWDEGLLLVCGVDEAGRGPLAGPVVAAAVIFPKGLFLPGVDDSKKLSPAKRELIYDEIHRAAAGVSVGVVEPEIIDRINILRATFLAMRKAVTGLPSVPECVLVDGFTIPGVNIRQVGIPGGDSLSQSIAAASVIAKVTRDRMMLEEDKLYPEYGFRMHKGYGTPQHMAALMRYGVSPIHRRSFAPVERALEKAMASGQARAARRRTRR